MNRSFGFLSLLLLGLFALPTATAGQTGAISGRVLSADGTPLPGVNVYIEDLALGSATDSDGQYLIEEITAGEVQITASVVGFRSESRTVIVEPDSLYEVDFRLDEIAVRASEVLVTATRNAQLSTSVPASYSLIEPRELVARNIIGLDQALRYVPGVQVLGNQVNVRGSSGFSYNTGSRVLLLLDGMPLMSPDTDGIPFDALPFDRIEQIEIIKGPGSALFGGGAIGGVINVLTEDYPIAPESAVQVFSGLHEPVRYDIWRENWPEGGDETRHFWGIRASHARRLSESLGFWITAEHRYDPGFANFNEERLSQIYAKIGWRITPGVRLDVLTNGLARNKESFIFWNGVDDALNPGQFALGDPNQPTGTTDAITNQFTVQPTLRGVISREILVQTRLRLFGTVIRPLDSNGDPKSVEDGTLGLRYGGEVQVDWSPTPGRSVVLGVSGDANTTDSSFFRTNDGDEIGHQPEAALFGQWEQALTDRLEAVGGLRYDYYSIDEVESVSKLSPKLAFTFEWRDGLSLRTAYGEGFRVPSLAERFVDNQDFLPLYRNPGLNPETSRSFEVGVRVLGPVGGLGSFRLDLAGFWNSYDEFIEPKLVRIEQAGQPTQVGFQFVNLTRARIAGFELGGDLDVDFLETSIRAGYTFLDSKDLDQDLDLAFRPDHLFTGGITTHPFRHLELGTDFRYAAEPSRIEPDFLQFVPDADVLVPTEVFDVWVALSWGPARLALHSKNAFDYYYLERPALLAEPRSWLAQLRVDL